MIEQIQRALDELKKNEKRNFTQTIDLVISLKGVDLKKSENKFVEDFALPHGRGKNANVVVFSDNLNGLDCDILTGADIQRYGGDKREARRLADNTDFFFSEAVLIPSIGRFLGQVLAPRGKMPKVIIGDPKGIVDHSKNSVRITVKNAPVIQCFVGREDMDNKKVAENVESILKFLETKLPRGRQNIGKVLLKYTMSKPVKVQFEKVK